MRIISGKFKKKMFFPPKNFTARPTTDMAKESLFNIIENLYDIDSVEVLDLFGGTGSISLEFASRECPSVTCVELNFHHYAFIKKTVDELKIGNAVMGFSIPSAARSSAILVGIKGMDLLTENGLFILEHSKGNHFDEHPYFRNKKNYGSVNFSFFAKPAPAV